MSFPASARARYQAGPWAGGKMYTEDDFVERLDEELRDFVEWVKPTEDERYVRKFTAVKYIREIEAVFPGSTVCLHGSSAAGSYLVTSDIDLVVFVGSSNPVQVLARMKQVFDAKGMISSGKVIAGARVPILAAIDRVTQLPIDVSVSNVGGVMMVMRMRSYLAKYPQLAAMGYFPKMFVKLNHLDKPFDGGFGSCELMHICVFVIQMHPEKSKVAELILELLKLIGEDLNFFLAGLSITGHPHYISKIDRSVFLDDIPQALVVEDSTDPRNVMGTHSSKAIELSQRFKSISKIMALSNGARVSALSTVFPNVDEFTARKADMSRIAAEMRSTCVSGDKQQPLRA